MHALRFTFEKDSRLLKYNDCDEKRRATFPSTIGEKRTIEKAEKTATSPGVERIEVLDEDDNVLYDSDSS